MFCLPAGDYSTHSLQVLYAWDKQLSEPKYTTADYLYHIRPDLKFIIMLRNPIDR